MELLRAAYHHDGQGDGEHTAFPTSQPSSDHQGSYWGGHVPVILVLVPMVNGHGTGQSWSFFSYLFINGRGDGGPGGPGAVKTR